jgi:acyl-CoA reductase-like NAD-dependent aldehyde dehydrogenase
MPRTISQFINGQSVTRIGAVTSPVYDPSTGQVQARLEHGDAAILAEVVAVAKAAQPAWAAINPQRRARVMFKFKALIEEHRQELVHLMSSEHGKNCWTTPTASCSAAWTWWSLSAASHICRRASSPRAPALASMSIRSANH